MEDEGKCVPKYVGWVSSSFTAINLICSIVFSNCNFQKFWDVEDKGDDGHRCHIDQHPHGAAQGLPLILKFINLEIILQ